MRIKLHLDNPVVDHQRILIHGSSNAGKTFLAGSAMSYYREKGEKVFYIDTMGDNGSRSLAVQGLGSEVAETVTTLKSFNEILGECHQNNVALLVLDSIKFIWDFIRLDVLGSDRVPIISKTSTDWQDLYRAWDRMLLDLIGASRDLFVLCASDVSRDQVGDRLMVSPDLPGRKIPDTVLAFDAVGYLQARPIGTKMRRSLHFEPMDGVITKIRARKSFDRPVPIATGPKVWDDVQAVLDERV